MSSAQAKDVRSFVLNEIAIHTIRQAGQAEGQKTPVRDRRRNGATDARPTLGSLLSGLRHRNNWTLKQMSERTGIPISTLSKVEHDRLTLTFDKLQQLAQRLGLKMSELFAEPEVEDSARPVMARRSVGTLENAVRINTKNYDYHYLCTELRRKRMVPILSYIRAKSVAEFGQLVRHSGEEWFYVLEGRVEVHTEFYDTILLEAGQSIYIDSNMGHAYLVGAGCDEAIIVGACSSDDDDHMKELISVHTVEEPDVPSKTATPRRGRKPGKVAGV
jgi:transcriptional regulator with XRE-family HTH domain